MIKVELRWRDGTVESIDVAPPLPVKLAATSDPTMSPSGIQRIGHFHRVPPRADGTHPTIYEET